MIALSHVFRLLACGFFAQAINWLSVDEPANATISLLTGVGVYAIAEKHRPA